MALCRHRIRYIHSSDRHLLNLTLLSIIVAVLASQATQAGSFRDVFTDATNPGRFEHLVVDTVTGQVYVGATNRLYQLQPTLRLESAVVTGPREDNPNCPPPSSDCLCFGSSCKDFEKVPLNSISKALVIDYRGERLISCISLFQGHCDKHLLRNITLTDPPVWTMLVPNDESSSVVMFIAPGPPNPASTDVLYVASSRSTKGLPAYKDIVPAVCMRNLQDLNFVSDDILTPSRIDIEVQQRDLFRVNYVYGFGSLGFSYFLTVQKISAITDSEKYITQISRICQNDKSLYSYTEVPLECHHRGTHYNILRAAYLGHPGTDLAKSLGLPHIAPLTDMEHILVAVFSNQSQTKAPSAAAAVCIYPLRDIRRKFTETIQKCFHGLGNTGPDHFVQPKACFKTPFEIGDDYCGQHDINHPIKGMEPVSRESIIVWPNANVSAVALTVTGDFTVAFVGTVDGHLRKVVIETSESAREYDSMVIQRNSHINQDMAFDHLKEHIYVMTDKKVFRVPVQDCGRHLTCSDCLGARDPFCGWCSLERRCTQRSACAERDTTLHWLPYNTGLCTRIVKMASTQAQKQSTSTSLVIMTVQNLPFALSGNYQCSFAGYGVTRNTSVVQQIDRQDSGNSTLKCETPTANLLPPFPTGKDHIVMTLSLVSRGQDFLSTNFTFFDCSLHSTCTRCTSSDFPCTWCVENHRCTGNKEECLADVLVTGRRVRGRSDMPGPTYCPRIETDGNSSEILISSGSEVGLKVMAVHLQEFQSMFKCYFNFNRGEERNARLRQDVRGNTFIECDPVLFQYSGSTHYINVPFSIRWGELTHKALDNPHNLQVRVFKCKEMASNCGRCRSIDIKHGCGWCSGVLSCTTHDQCHHGPWLQRDETCPDPSITTFLPETGPLEGGTRLNVTGENLGLGISDTIVTISGTPCNIVRYEPSVWFVCETSPSENQTTGPLLVTIANKFTAVSPYVFSYVRPFMTGFSPTRGPLSGGTHLTIHGNHLDAGSSASMVLSNGSLETRCSFVQRQRHSAICVTAPAAFLYEADTVLMSIDGALPTLIGSRFRFVEDPVIEFVMPEKSVFSGGSKISVRGKRLDSVTNPSMVIYVQGQSIRSPCDLVSHEQMICTAPNLHSLSQPALSEPAPDEPLAVHYGFILDGVGSLANITTSETGFHMFLVYPDPKFEEFEGGVKQFFSSKNEYLTINGKFLTLALTENDIRVTVSDLECAITSISSTQLTCLPSDLHLQSTVTGKVLVHIGNNTSYFIGDLKYEGPQSFLLTLPFLVGIAGGAAVLVTIIVIICVAYRRKSRESDRVMKRMKNSMDVLEARVAKECKEAFAELQTDMTVVTSNISGPGGIPFREYRNFCMRVLFPGVPGNEHPVMRPLDTDVPSTEATQYGLRLFEQLISNKTFLLLFIRTLEQHENFAVQEKVNVASLLSVALQDRMVYHTDILKTLLAELIERAMAGKCHPKLLLRRTESVAEKMLTNWFTFLLYRFLRESVGEPLFVLFRAIKQQVEKGPIDAVSGEAKYSLSEDKLIRQQIDYHPMTLRVLDPDIQFMQEYSVKVLDCDNITQVKEKILDAIYRNSLHSSRPNKDDVELEWRTGSTGTGCVPLRDEDLTTKHDGEFRRLNTLAHYCVPEGALMALVPKKCSMVNLALSTEKIAQSSRFDGFFSGSLPHSPSVLASNTINKQHDYGSRYYHLVKPHDPDLQKEGERGSKMVSEIYLTRLLSTKVTLQQFVDDLFETLFSTINRGSVLPLAIKHLFDFLDDQAIHHGITDPEVVHTWKSNSLPLRFWVNVIKNPDFVFDIFKSNIVDSCLSVVAQSFMGSCAMSELKLSKDSPSSKLLYAKDIPKYKKWVERYYEDIQQMPAISEQDMNAMLNEESKSHLNEFNTSAALYELYLYTKKYNDDFMQALEEDEFARNHKLAYRLNQVRSAMDSEV